MIGKYISPSLLNIENATIRRGGKTILDNISLRVSGGEHIAIVGPNGSGKSTLIKLITYEYYPLAGDNQHPKVEVFGRERWDVFELRSKLGILSNDLQQNFIEDAGLDTVETVLSGFFASKGVATHQKVTPKMIDAAHRALKIASAERLIGRSMGTLSTGEARRVLIARALVSDPSALILDEPTAGLDIAARRRFLHAVQQITHHGMTVILVTHHVEEIIPEIERVVLMKDGKIYKDGPKNEVLTRGNLSEVFDEPIELRKQGEYYSAEIEFASKQVSDLD